MGLFHRKNAFQRAIDQVDAGALAKSGAATAATVVGMTALSAVVSTMRRKERT